MINQMQGQSQLRVKQHFDFMVSFEVDLFDNSNSEFRL